MLKKFQTRLSGFFGGFFGFADKVLKFQSSARCEKRSGAQEGREEVCHPVAPIHLRLLLCPRRPEVDSVSLITECSALQGVIQHRECMCVCVCRTGGRDGQERNGRN